MDVTETSAIALTPLTGRARVGTAPVEQPKALKTRRGALTLALLLLVQFLDFLDVSIVNVALPAIKDDLHFAQQSLQWVVSGYVVTYGGLLLLAGRAADLVGRRRILVSGLVLFAIASLAGGLAQTEAALVAARLAQGAGAAMMSPAALSVLTTTFTDRRDRNLALGAWAAVPGLAGAFGVVLSGVLTEGPGWRWIFYLNVPVAILAGLGALALLDRQPRRGRQSGFDFPGAVLVTAGMLLLIYALVRAPEIGWGTAETMSGLAVAAALLAAFVANERRARTPLVPFSIFRIKGLAAANVTQLITFSGLYSMFFFLSLYMQRVLGYSPSHTGLAYLPLTAGFMISAGIATPLVPRIGTKPVIVGGALVALGAGAVFTGVTTAATEGVPADHAGIASGLLNASMQFGGASGLAVLSAVATDRTGAVLGSGGGLPQALTAGFQRAFLIGALFALVAALVALLAANARSVTKA